MTLYFSQESDINISLNVSNGVLPSREERYEVARLLYNMYAVKKTVNNVRSFASCPVCREYCDYSLDGNVVQLGGCSIIYERNGVNILIPVEWIHILQRHDTPVDPRLIDLFLEKSGGSK